MFMKNEELLQLFEKRQSVRAYTDKPVEKEKLMRCIEAARLAPSACNAQPWKYIIIDDPELKNIVADTISGGALSINHFTRQAPVIIGVVQEKANWSSSAGQLLKRIDYPLMDIGISVIQFCLQATAEGLGTCMMGWFNQKKIKQLLYIPRNKRLELMLTVGYPLSDEIREKRRKETNEILSFNSY
jgi:nitroreductase